MLGTAVALGLAGAGALTGALGKNETQTSHSTIDAGSATGNEMIGQGGMMNAFGQIQNMVNSGPGQSDVTAGVGAQRDFASLLQQYSQNGAGPTAQDMSQSNSIAQQLFAPQQTALNQSFVDQGVAADRQAALMGRSGNDPILQAKLRTEQMRQSAMLGANQGAFAQQYALQQPFQRLGFAQQRAGVLSGLASQAMANRQMLAGMGEGIMNNERNFRLQTASRNNTTTQQSGGGLGGAITGGIAGLSAGMNFANAMGMPMGGSGYSNFGQAGGPVAPHMMAPYSNPYFNKGQ